MESTAAAEAATTAPVFPLTKDELAVHLKVPKATVTAGLLKGWPRTRFGKHVRFTEDDVAAIVAMSAWQPTTAAEVPAAAPASAPSTPSTDEGNPWGLSSVARRAS